MKDALEVLYKMAFIGTISVMGLIGFGIYKLVIWLI